MESDERAIRAVHTAWIDAVNAGDLVRLLSMMADDVVFLNPGQAPFGREGFPAGFSAAHQQSRIRCISELEEVVVVGEVAYTRLAIRCPWHRAPAGKPPSWPVIGSPSTASSPTAAGSWHATPPRCTRWKAEVVRHPRGLQARETCAVR